MYLHAALCLALLGVVFVLDRFLKLRRSRLPPGPKGLPIVGNIFDIPNGFEWHTYTKWARDYGSDLIYLNFIGTPVIVVNSAEHAIELFEKRSTLYSDRPRTVMATELVGWSFDFAFTGYGDEWRMLRRMFHQHFNAHAMVEYNPHVSRAVGKTLLRLLERPDDFMPHLRHMAGDIILFITYGIKVKPINDPYIDIAERALSTVNACTNAGSYMVRYLPSWMPGAGFKRQAAIWHQWVTDMLIMPYAAVKNDLARGTAGPSVVSTLIAELDETVDNTERERAIRDVAATAYTGGADTSVSAIGTLILALLLHPDVQRRGQAELDRVIGQDRLPTLEDLPNLPYITAIFREGMRWHPVSNLAMPHALSKDDEYLSYHFPAGALVIGNTWAILHGETRYPDPESFNPGRFMTPEGALDANVPNPEDFGFGFGRRVCPGRYLASNSVWLSLASILAVFDLELPVDELGRKIKPSGEYTPGLISYPVPFQCNFKPRSAQAETLIRAAAYEAEA